MSEIGSPAHVYLGLLKDFRGVRDRIHEAENHLLELEEHILNLLLNVHTDELDKAIEERSINE